MTMGRPVIGDKPMTATERKRRSRALKKQKEGVPVKKVAKRYAEDPEIRIGGKAIRNKKPDETWEEYHAYLKKQNKREMSLAPTRSDIEKGKQTAEMGEEYYEKRKEHEAALESRKTIEGTAAAKAIEAKAAEIATIEKRIKTAENKLHRFKAESRKRIAKQEIRSLKRELNTSQMELKEMR